MNKELNIYQKLQLVQQNIGQLKKDQLNAFQKYRYVSEYDILRTLRPLLNQQNLLLTFSDETANENNLIFQKQDKEWIVKYLKKMTIINCENTTEQLTFNFWACGQNTDLAKAKGSAETYAIKYLLMKFFIIPTSDNLDPDSK